MAAKCYKCETIIEPEDGQCPYCHTAIELGKKSKGLQDLVERWAKDVPKRHVTAEDLSDVATTSFFKFGMALAIRALQKIALGIRLEKRKN